MNNDPTDATDAAASTATADETNPATPAGAGASTAADELAALTPAALAELKAEAAKAREHREQWIRTTADFENYKKRAAREKQDATKYATEGLLFKLISVLDSFDMAVAAAGSSADPAAKSLHTGVNMILAQLRSALSESGLEEIDALGKPFDPNLHEAISQQERADVPEGQVIQQSRKGFKLRDRLLRPASVIVSRKPSASA